jgi:hypothetical protein
MTQGKQSIWQRSTTVRLMRWLFSKRVLKFVSKVLVIGIPMVAAYYAQEDLLGYRAWKSYLSHEGITPDQLDLRSYIPKSVPDDENFAATPVVKKWFATKWENQPWRSDHFSKAPSLLVKEIKDVEKKKSLRHLDLAAWRHGLVNDSSIETRPQSRQQHATAILAALQDDEEMIQSVRAASVRAKSTYPVNYTLDDPWQILLPHLSNIEQLGIRLNLMASAELAVHDSNKAFNDVLLTLYLADSLTNDAFVISYLIRAGCVHAAVQPIWEGLAEHRWSDRQLQEFETRLLRFNFVSELERPLKMERAVGVLTIDLTRRRGVTYLARTAFNEPTEFNGLIGKAMDRTLPAGWFAREKVSYCRLWNTLFADAFDPATGTISPTEASANQEAFNRDVHYGKRGLIGIVLHHQIVARMFLPALPKCIFRAAIAQTAADQAALACALERCHLANKRYPSDLQSLVPRWIPTIPHGVIEGSDYIYRAIDSDHFVLYSVGWDEKDDGGTPGALLFSREGDWVWTNAD